MRKHYLVYILKFKLFLTKDPLGFSVLIQTLADDMCTFLLSKMSWMYQLVASERHSLLRDSPWFRNLGQQQGKAINGWGSESLEFTSTLFSSLSVVKRFCDAFSIFNFNLARCERKLFRILVRRSAAKSSHWSL